MLLPRLRKALAAAERDEKIKRGRERSLAVRQGKTHGDREAVREAYVRLRERPENWKHYPLCIEVLNDPELKKVLRNMPSLNTILRWTQDLPPLPHRKRS